MYTSVYNQDKTYNDNFVYKFFFIDFGICEFFHVDIYNALAS